MPCSIGEYMRIYYAVLLCALVVVLCTLPFFGLMSLVLRYLDSGRAEAQRRKRIAIQGGQQNKLRKALGIRSPSKAAAEYSLAT